MKKQTSNITLSRQSNKVHRQLELFPLANKRQKSHKRQSPHPLQSKQLPPALQWWSEERFWLIHSASGLRVPGTWTADEVELILDLSKTWDWSIGRDSRVACGLQLIALAEAVCKRSVLKGGER